MKKNRTILITGVNGYIGSKLALRLSAAHTIIGIDRQEMPVPSLASKISYAQADITAPERIPSMVRNAGTLIHCAALVHNRSKDLSRENYFRVNAAGTKNILNAASRVKRVILFSTVSVYGGQAGIPDETSPLKPEEYYAESKIEAENIVKDASRKKHIAFTLFRFAPIYGADFMLNLSKRIYLPGKIAFYRIGSGMQRLSLCSVENALAAVIRSIDDKTFFGKTFNCADRAPYTVNDVIRAFRSYTPRPTIPIPRMAPLTALGILGLVLPKKANFIRRQIMKITDDAVFSTAALDRTRLVRAWDLARTISELRSRKDA